MIRSELITPSFNDFNLQYPFNNNINSNKNTNIIGNKINSVKFDVDFKNNKLNSISIYDQGYPEKIASPLYMSLVTDTGSFKYSNTTSDAHIMAANLIDSGVKGYEIQRSIYEQQKLVSIILLAKVVQRLKHSENMKAVWTIITQSMLNEIGATQNDIDGVTEYIRSIKDVEISFMILELSDGSFRINFRSSGNYSVNDIAEIFNGGGHKFAAGARLDDSYDISRIESIIIEKINEKIPGEINVN